MSESEQNDDFLNQLYGLYDAKADDLDLGSPQEMPLFSNLKSEKNRYSQEELIAKGGMKEILKVFDEKTGRKVAMARLHKGSPEELYEPFLREARLTALLDHPNIISIYDIGLDQYERPYFTMEFKNGKSFNESISHESVSKTNIQNNLEIFIKICDAVSYAHSKGVLHLDLKPENIQVGTYGEVVVCDWGLGKVIDRSEGDIEFDQLLLNPDLLNNMTLAGEIRGTPGYMAPEQIQKGGQKSPQTDIYALGAILHAILCGKAPIEGDTETVLNKTLEGKVSFNFPSSVPDSLKAVVAKAISLTPQKRYDSVNLLRADVHKYLSGYATDAEAANSFTQLKLFIRRNKSLCTLSFSFILSSLLATGIFIQNLNESRIIAEEARSQAEKEKLIAEKNLQLYLKGQKKINNMANFRSDELLKEGKIYRNTLFFENPQKFLDAALAKANKAIKINKNPQAYYEKGYLLFLKQDFKGALEAFNLGHVKYPYLFNKCKNLVLIEKTSEGLLPIDELAKLVKSGASKINYYEKMIAFDITQRNITETYGVIIENLLRLINPGKGISLKYEPHRQAIILEANSPIQLISEKEWSSEKSILRLLKAERIEIRGHALDQLKQLRGMNTIKEVDLRGSSIKDLSYLNKIPSISRIITDRKQYTKTELSVLSRRILLKEK